MAQVSITLDNLFDGQEVEVPYEVTGSAASNTTRIVAMARQIDNNAQQSLAFVEANSTPPPSNVTFNFELTAADCPDVDTWYMLTIYCWDSDGDLTLKSVSFKRIAAEVDTSDLVPV